jgi:threonine synthase
VACTSKVSGLQVANVIDADMVIPAVRETGGHGFLVEDETVFKWQAHLAQVEGIFAEPAGSTALAGLAAAVDEGRVGKNDHAVCLVTGSGFKDPKSLAAFTEPENVKTYGLSDWRTAWWG